MKKLVIVTCSIICASFFGIAVNAQNPSLELSWLSGSWNPAPGPTQGPSLATQLQTFQNDALNNSNFSNYSPAVSVTTSLRNQVFTGYNYSGIQGTVSTGLSFGTSKSEWNDAVVTTQGPRASNLFDLIGANVGAHGPTASLYRSFAGEALGTIDADFSQFGADGNGGVSLFTTVEPLKTLPGVDKAGRYEYGELVIRFSRKVKDPVINIASLGGSSWYQTSVGAPWNMAYFTTELELVTPGFTSVKLSGTPYLDVQGNNILNNAARPNGDSQSGAVDVKGFSTFGSASGSIQVNGVVDSLVYKVYMRGSSLSDYPFTFDAVAILGASRNPFYGDFWSISYSLKTPNQQISGNVFIDPQTTDNNINQSFGNANARTNAGGMLYANLIQGGLVVATVPVSANGDFLFDNVPVNNGYTVQLSSNQGVVGNAPPASALPANWINTGEFIGTGVGTDGTINGISASFNVAASNIVEHVNFGIKAGPCPNNVLYTVPPTLTGYFGGFELTPAAANFFPAGVNYSNGRGRIYPATPLAPADYSVTSNPNLFSPALSSYPALGGQSQMAIRPSANNQVVYYIMDSAGKTNAGGQIYFISGPGPGGDYNFRGWFAKSTAADAIVKIKIYDADVPARVFKDINVTVTGPAGSWVYWSAPWNVNYGVPGSFSQTKKVVFDIISVNGAPFSIDELCFDEPALGPPLPITLADFAVNKTNCNANLVWKTSTEINSDRFEVEVSTGNNAVYTLASTVMAAGSSSTAKTYQFSYPMQTGEVYYFRIKMIDKNGSFTYSNVLSSDCSKGGGGIIIAPNPVVDKFMIRGMENGKNTILVYGANGQLVKTQTSTTNNSSVNISYLAPGMYTVKVTSEKGNTVIRKLIKH